MKKLIVIVSLISYNCASTGKVINPLITLSEEKKDNETFGIRQIDPINPPLDGVWMTWSDAKNLADYQRQERVSCSITVLDVEKDREICGISLKKTEKALQEQDGSVNKWFNKWGFPLGVIIGGLIGVAVPIAIGVHK